MEAASLDKVHDAERISYRFFCVMMSNVCHKVVSGHKGSKRVPVASCPPTSGCRGERAGCIHLWEPYHKSVCWKFLLPFLVEARSKTDQCILTFYPETWINSVKGWLGKGGWSRWRSSSKAPRLVSLPLPDRALLQIFLISRVGQPQSSLWPVCNFPIHQSLTPTLLANSAPLPTPNSLEGCASTGLRLLDQWTSPRSVANEDSLLVSHFSLSFSYVIPIQYSAHTSSY